MNQTLVLCASFKYAIASSVGKNFAWVLVGKTEKRILERLTYGAHVSKFAVRTENIHFRRRTLLSQEAYAC
jgi:hypothetical protein